MISNFKVVEAGRPRLDRAAGALLSGPWPTRNWTTIWPTSPPRSPPTSRGSGTSRLVDRYRWRSWRPYMGHIQRAAEQKMRAALAGFPVAATHVDHLDDGSPIAVDDNSRWDGRQSTSRAQGRCCREPQRQPRDRHRGRDVLSSLPDPRGHSPQQGVLAPVRIVLPECLLNPPPGPTPEQCRPWSAETWRRRNGSSTYPGRPGSCRRQPGDDEQPALRRRDLRLLRDDLRRRRGHAPGRRGRRRPHAHDQHAADRPRSPRDRAIPSDSRNSRSAAAQAAPAGIEAATASSAESSSSPSWKSPCSPSAADLTPLMVCQGGQPGALGRNILQAGRRRHRNFPAPSISRPIRATP